MNLATATAYGSTQIEIKPTWNILQLLAHYKVPPADMRNLDAGLATKISGPTPIPAAWLPKVETRLRDSTLPASIEKICNDGSWISRSIANTAERFFQSTSDILPAEPHIYSSTKGDLVAEFDTPGGKLTSIVGESFVIAFAVIDGEIVKEELQLKDYNFDAARQKFRLLTKKLSDGHHGAVDSKTR